MSDIPAELRYTKDHEWVRQEDDGTLTIGVTDYAQESLGDITFVELPEEGERFDAGDTFGVVESVKAASDLYMPVAGEVVQSNAELETAPEDVNSDPYGAAWMLKIKPDDASAFESLLSAADYNKVVD
ncbi:MAG: glycine cleavage system protein GcvH [Verrucomicrobiota bacterium]